MGEAEAFSWNGQLHSHLCLFWAGELERLEQPRAPCAECPSVTYVDDKTSAPECWRECQSLRLSGSVVDLCSQDVMWQEGVQRSGPLTLARLRDRELCRRCPQSQEGPVSRLRFGALSPWEAAGLCPEPSLLSFCLFWRAQTASSFNFQEAKSYKKSL